ncbi:MAG: hypothetical protein ACI4UU_00505 [Clostridia bacterium]
MNYTGYFQDNEGNKYYPGIVESGSNENGHYIKFVDGTMICYLNITATDQSINTQYGTSALYFGTRRWTFPQVFISAPVVNCGSFRWGTSGSWGSVTEINKTYATLIGYDFYPRATGTSTQIKAIAIGKWK